MMYIACTMQCRMFTTSRLYNALLHMKRLIQQSVGSNESGHTDMPNRYAESHAVVHDQLLDHNDSLVGLTQACHQCLIVALSPLDVMLPTVQHMDLMSWKKRLSRATLPFLASASLAAFSAVLATFLISEKVPNLSRPIYGK